MPEDSLDQPAGSLPPVQVLKEEFECLHGSLPPGTDDLGAVYAVIHSFPEPRSALCLSGGDIRSTAFALGIIQGLARTKVLAQFHYLSTVAAGGYIGGWLTAWVHHSGDNVGSVADSLATGDDAPRTPLARGQRVYGRGGRRFKSCRRIPPSRTGCPPSGPAGARDAVLKADSSSFPKPQSLVDSTSRHASTSIERLARITHCLGCCWWRRSRHRGTGPGRHIETIPPL